MKLRILYVFQVLDSSNGPELTFSGKFRPVWRRTCISPSFRGLRESFFLSSHISPHLRGLPLELLNMESLVTRKVWSGLAVHKQKHYKSRLINACFCRNMRYCCWSSVLPTTWKQFLCFRSWFFSPQLPNKTDHSGVLTHSMLKTSTSFKYCNLSHVISAISSMWYWRP